MPTDDFAAATWPGTPPGSYSADPNRVEGARRPHVGSAASETSDRALRCFLLLHASWRL